MARRPRITTVRAGAGTPAWNNRATSQMGGDARRGGFRDRGFGMSPSPVGNA